MAYFVRHYGWIAHVLGMSAFSYLALKGILWLGKQASEKDIFLPLAKELAATPPAAEECSSTAPTVFLVVMLCVAVGVFLALAKPAWPLRLALYSLVVWAGWRAHE